MQVFREAQAALQSIFTKHEAEEFIHNTKNECVDQLVELTKLVTGIRLFNRDCKKGGEGIEDCKRSGRNGFVSNFRCAIF